MAYFATVVNAFSSIVFAFSTMVDNKSGIEFTMQLTSGPINMFKTTILGLIAVRMFSLFAVLSDWWTPPRVNRLRLGLIGLFCYTFCSCFCVLIASFFIPLYETIYLNIFYLIPAALHALFFYTLITWINIKIFRLLSQEHHTDSVFKMYPRSVKILCATLFVVFVLWIMVFTVSIVTSTIPTLSNLGDVLLSILLFLQLQQV